MLEGVGREREDGDEGEVGMGKKGRMRKRLLGMMTWCFAEYSLSWFSCGGSGGAAGCYTQRGMVVRHFGRTDAVHVFRAISVRW